MTKYLLTIKIIYYVYTMYIKICQLKGNIPHMYSNISIIIILDGLVAQRKKKSHFKVLHEYMGCPMQDKNKIHHFSCYSSFFFILSPLNKKKVI